MREAKTVVQNLHLDILNKIPAARYSRSAFQMLGLLPMSAISILPGEASWRSRNVRYYAGDWDSIQTVIPDFRLIPFATGPNEPANPFLQAVMRLPQSSSERAIPVGVVSHTYALASHREVSAICLQALVNAGIDASRLRYEVGISELGEWMNFRIYFPPSYAFSDGERSTVDLRLECFNSVEGSARLLILLGWFRFVCANGLVIGDTKIEINQRHGSTTLDLDQIPLRLQSALEAVGADRARIEAWQTAQVRIGDIAAWADHKVATKWGKKAAARVYHICDAGKDVEFSNPFASGEATQKPTRYLNRVPGSPERARTKYDVAQALSYVATHRRNVEEPTVLQAAIPAILGLLPAA